MSNALEQAMQHDLDDLEIKKATIEGIHQIMPRAISVVSELTGISEEDVVSLSVAAAWHHKDIYWYQVVEILRSFYLAKKNLEKRE